MIARRPKKRKGPLPEYRYLGCPLTNNHTAWCYRLCTPVNGMGRCGRPAPHCFVGKTRLAIAAQRLSEESDSWGASTE